MEEVVGIEAQDSTCSKKPILADTTKKAHIPHHIISAPSRLFWSCNLGIYKRIRWSLCPIARFLIGPL